MLERDRTTDGTGCSALAESGRKVGTFALERGGLGRLDPFEAIKVSRCEKHIQRLVMKVKGHG